MFPLSVCIFILGSGSVALGISCDRIFSHFCSLEYPLSRVVRMDFVLVGIAAMTLGIKLMKFIKKPKSKFGRILSRLLLPNGHF